MNDQFKNPLYHIPEGCILCGSSALEFMGYFSGYLYDDTIYVYARDPEHFPNHIRIVPMPSASVNIGERNGIRYTSFAQTVNDMLSNAELSDPDALMESLYDYLAAHNGQDPDIRADNIERYNYYKGLCRNYYSEA